MYCNVCTESRWWCWWLCWSSRRINNIVSYANYVDNDVKEIEHGVSEGRGNGENNSVGLAGISNISATQYMSF